MVVNHKHPQWYAGVIPYKNQQVVVFPNDAHGMNLVINAQQVAEMECLQVFNAETVETDYGGGASLRARIYGLFGREVALSPVGKEANNL